MKSFSYYFFKLFEPEIRHELIIFCSSLITLLYSLFIFTKASSTFIYMSTLIILVLNFNTMFYMFIDVIGYYHLGERINEK